MPHGRPRALLPGEAPLDPAAVAATIDPGPVRSLVATMPADLINAGQAIADDHYDRAAIPGYWLAPGRTSTLDFSLDTAVEKERAAGMTAGATPAGITEGTLAELADAYFRVAMCKPDGKVLAAVKKGGKEKDAIHFLETLPLQGAKLHAAAVARLLRSAGQDVRGVAYRQLGDIALRRGELGPAARYYRQALAVVPAPRPFLWLTLADALQKDLQGEGARSALASARDEMDAAPTEEQFHARKRVTLLEQNQLALEVKLASLKAPLDLEFARAEVLLELDDKTLAQARADALRARYPKDARPLLLQSTIALYAYHREESALLLNTAWGMENKPADFLNRVITTWNLRWLADLTLAMDDIKNIELRRRLWASGLLAEWETHIDPALRQQDPDRATLLQEGFVLGKTCYGGIVGTLPTKTLHARAEALYARHPGDDRYASLVASAAVVSEGATSSTRSLVSILRHPAISAERRAAALRSLATVLLVRDEFDDLGSARAAILESPPGNDVNTVLARGTALAVLARRENDIKKWEAAILEYRRALDRGSENEFIVLTNNYAVALAEVGHLKEADALLNWEPERVNRFPYVRLNAAILRARHEPSLGLPDLWAFISSEKSPLNMRFLATAWFVSLGGARTLSKEQSREMIRLLRGEEKLTHQNMYDYEHGAFSQFMCNPYYEGEHPEDEADLIFTTSRRIWLGFLPPMTADALRRALGRIEQTPSNESSAD